jgi:hypothetical protein
MGRTIDILPNVPELRRTAEADNQLAGCCSWEIENALSARHPQEADWRECRRQYAAHPRKQYRSSPIPDAPNIEVPLGAQHCDTLYAQAIDTIYAGDPLLTCRANDEKFERHAKAMQRWVNYVAANDCGMREATDHAYLNNIQLGTAAFYVPYVEETVQTRFAKIVDRGPRIIPIAPENVLFMGGSRGNLQADRWVALRFWMTPGELELYRKKCGWDTSKAMPIAMTDWVRQQYEWVSLTTGSNNYYEYFEIYRIAMRYDYHNDGTELDLEVIFDRSSQKVLDVNYYPYDERAIVPMRYQLRPDLAYGLGVMSMLRPHQEENTEVHNYRLLNMFLANTRCWSAVEGSVPESMVMHPGKIIPVREVGALQEHRLSDVYPSSAEAEGLINAMAERRVGTEGQAGSSANESKNIGTRTPGITALSQIQAMNRRFIPPFDQMRLATAEALRQCLLRQRERLKMGGGPAQQMENHMRSVIGDDAKDVIDILKMADYRKYVGVDFTSATPQTNREADRQAMLQVSNFMFAQYYKPAMELLAQAVNPQSPPEIRDIAKQIIVAANEMADRTLRTYDQIRDPKPLLLDTDKLLKDQTPEQAQAQQTSAIMQKMFGGDQGGGGDSGAGGGGPGGPPAPPSPRPAG